MATTERLIVLINAVLTGIMQAIRIQKPHTAMYAIDSDARTIYFLIMNTFELHFINYMYSVYVLCI